MQLRIRTVKPEFFKHEKLFDIEKATGLPIRLAWVGLFAISDREGRFNWRPRTIKAETLPYDEVDFAKVLQALQDAKMVLKYEVDGETYGWIPSFTKHQVINNRESASNLPPHPDDACPTRAPRVTDAGSVEGKGEEGNRTEGVGGAAPADATQKQMGLVHPELAGNSKRIQVLSRVSIDLQQDWVDRYESKWLKDSILHAIQTYAKNDPIDCISDWAEKLIRWFKIEKKPKYKSIIAQFKPREPVVSQIHGLTPLNEIIGMNVLDALAVAKKQKQENVS